MKNFPRNAFNKTVEAGIFASTFLPMGALAVADDAGNCDPTQGSITAGAACSKANSNADSLFGPSGIFKTIANIMIFLVGAIAVIMLILGGLQYVISNGDAKRVESAKNTILYAIIGIVVAILAYAAVAFVTGSLTGSTTSTGQ
ncbi:MAG TPA: pilin [Candidatus Saccharimonadales bacterium]|nr:pilin [Candidatus Saccharimonadales bacterium]